MSIIVEQARKQFGDFVALDDVSIEVPDGSLTALLGPSGSGKSTLLRVIAGLEQPDSGRIVILGEDATGIPAQHRGVGFVFEQEGPDRPPGVPPLEQAPGVASAVGPPPEPVEEPEAVSLGARRESEIGRLPRPLPRQVPPVGAREHDHQTDHHHEPDDEEHGARRRHARIGFIG